MAKRSRKTQRPERAEPVPEKGDPATLFQLETSSPRAVFGDLIAQALGALGTNPSPPAIGYLIDLLEFQVRAPTAHAPDGVGTPTLAEALLTAISEGGCAQPSRLRDLGDHALFVSGFFGESLRSSEVGLEYYGDVGRTAYSRLSNQLCRSADDDGLRTLFEELADEFGSFVELLAEVGGRTRPEAPLDLLSVYDRYVETGNNGDRARLIRLGLLPPPAESLRRWQ